MDKTLRDPRKAFSETLLDIGAGNAKLLAVSCDSASGAGLGDFIKAFPERYVEVGISEQNAIGICAGLAERGFIPVVSAIAPFISTRCYEQIRNDIGYADMNVKIVGSSSGLAFSTLSFSHEPVEDMCIMRSIPNMAILNPGDAFEVEMALREAVSYKGPVYIRMPRHPFEDIAVPSERAFKMGKGEEIMEGGEINILATGTMVREALDAAEILRAKGVSTGVIDIHTVKPLDTGIIDYACKKSKMLVSVEEHSVVGGLGSAVSEVLSAARGRAPLLRLGVREGGTNVGPYREVLESYSLTGGKIAESIYDQYIRG
jgi:transketolase